MIQSTQRKMLRLIIQKNRKYKNRTQDKNEVKVKQGVRKPENEKDGEEGKENHGALKTKLLMETASTQIAIKTVTSPS